ncbi:MAG: hypothetical protein AB4372_07985 [Xenococcus sp. (in: cyanobacteria)]
MKNIHLEMEKISKICQDWPIVELALFGFDDNQLILLAIANSSIAKLKL